MTSLFRKLLFAGVRTEYLHANIERMFEDALDEEHERLSGDARNLSPGI